MQIDRRNALKAFFGGAAATALPTMAYASPVSIAPTGANTFTLGNGLRTHFIANGSGYVTATLVLRSKEITHNGLAHLCEHTSCTGAAGDMTAAQVAAIYKDCVQDGNATTEAGSLKWDASFLPRYLPEVLKLLAVSSLDQKFDIPTIAAQQRVVLEELYLEKYSSTVKAECKFDHALYGASHPYSKETLKEEIARCKIAPEELAVEMREFARKTRLPANMDLFIVGGIEPDVLRREVEKSFGGYAFARGDRLEIPSVAVTSEYKPLSEPSFELQRPMSDLRIAWNTGACFGSSDARVLAALSSYLNTALFDELREKDGDTYTPDAVYEPDSCSGVFRVSISSSKDPLKVEKKVFDVIEKMKQHIDGKELARQRDRMMLKRCRAEGDNQALLERMMDRTLEGSSVGDLAIDSVTADEMIAAARKYLPAHRQAYVRLALNGQ